MSVTVNESLSRLTLTWHHQLWSVVTLTSGYLLQSSWICFINIWRLWRALPSIFDLHLFASCRTRLLLIVKCLIFLEYVVLGDENSVRWWWHYIHVCNWTHVISDQTSWFALCTHVVFVITSKCIAHWVSWWTNYLACFLWRVLRVCVKLFSVVNSILGMLSNTLRFCVWIEVMWFEIFELLVALSA